MVAVGKISLGQKIRIARDEAEPRWSQYQLAEHLGIQRARLANWELERSEPPKIMIQRLSAVLKVPLDWFYNDEIKLPPKVSGSEATVVTGDTFLRDGFTTTAEVRSWRGASAADPDDDDEFERDEMMGEVALYYLSSPTGMRKPEQMELLQVIGMSAYPRIRPGAEVLVFTGGNRTPGDIVMAMNQFGKVIIKALDIDHTARRLYLRSVNEKDSARYELSDWTLCGSVVMIRHGGLTEFENGRALKADDDPFAEFRNTQ